MTLHAPENLSPFPIPAEPAPGIATPRTRRRSLLARFRSDDSGQDLIEYALAAALIGLSGVSSMNGLAANIADSFNGIGNAVANAIPADNSAGTSGSGSGAPSNNNSGRRGGRGGGFGGFGFGGHRRH